MKNNDNLYNILHNFNKATAQSPAQSDNLPKATSLLESTMSEVLANQYLQEKAEAKKPSAGMTKSEKSAVVKKAKAGGDIGKPGKGFAKVEKAAAKGGAKDPEAVAAAAMWKGQAKKVEEDRETLKTKSGTIYKGGTYGTSYDVGSDAPAPSAQRGRGRPKKGSDETGSVSKPDWSAFTSKVKAPKTASGVKHKMVGEEQVDEKAKSKQQQKFFGMAHAIQKGEKVKGASPELKKVAKSMGKQDVNDFASTKHKGLPKKVDEGKVKQLSMDLEELSNAEFLKKYKVSKAEAKKNLSVAEGRLAASHRTIDKMIDDIFESIDPAQDAMDNGAEEQLSYEQQHLKEHIGGHLFKQLTNAMKTGDDFPDNLYDVLYQYYMDEMPYGTAKARTGDPYEWIGNKLSEVFGELDEARMVPQGDSFASQGYPELDKQQQFEPSQVQAPVAKPSMLGRAGRAIAGGVKKVANVLGGPGDEELLNRLRDTSAMEDAMDHSLSEMMRLAGRPVKEAAEKKADKDYDKDGKVESGKDEYLGSKINAAKKAGKLKEGEVCGKCECDPCECDSKDKVDECSMSPFTNSIAQEQDGKMSINTSMSTDGNKNVSISADGNAALQLMQMLKLAGMAGGEAEQAESPAAIMVAVEPEVEEVTDEGNAFTGALATARSDGVQPGENMNVGGKLYPVTGEEEVEEDSRFAANTSPEEHVYPAQIQTKGGDGEVAGQEKRMHKHSYRQGDNPMAMREGLTRSLMKEYESIKVKK